MSAEPQLAVVAEQTGDGPPLVGIVMGSQSDMDTMEAAAKELGERGIPHEIRVMSAHRQPDLVSDYAKDPRVAPVAMAWRASSVLRDFS